MLFKKLTLTGSFVCWVWLGCAQLSDQFSDGDFTVAPPWTGSTTYMVNAAFELQLNNTVAATTYLSTASALSSLDNTEWDIYLQQAFAPSGSNFGRIYLVSDQADVTGPLNGYYLQLGETGALDAVELFRQDGLSSTSVCRGTDGNIAAAFAIRIKVLRDNTGLWQLHVDYSGGTTYVLDASGTDLTYTSSAFFGMQATYTLSNATKFHYDDIYAGPLIVDHTPPVPSSVVPLSAHNADVLFNEPLDPTSAQVSANYNVNGGIGMPSTALLDGSDPKLVHLNFTSAFTNFTTYEIVVNNVADVGLNAIDNDTIGFMYFESDTAVFRDVVINEMLVDENPSVGLPAAEFVELYNRSSKSFDLSGWTFSDGSTTSTFGSKSLLPGQYLIICSNADTSAYQVFGNTLGVPSLPSLNNSGDDLVLKNNAGMVVNHVAYSSTWYHDALKDDGGYTLEQINPDGCVNAANWSASNATIGGTPGTVNSIYDNTPDTTAPQMTGYHVSLVTQMTVDFSEPLDTSATGSFAFNVSGGIAVSSFSIIAPANNQVLIHFAAPIDTGIVYTLTAINIQDCSGNGSGTSASMNFILPFPATYRQVVINEFLADENPQVALPAAEFIEVFNRSASAFNLEGWTLSDGSTTATLGPKILGPGQYLILCAVSDTNDYKIFGNVLGVPSIPTLNNPGDNIVLNNNYGQTIDALVFNTTWYRDPLKDDGGWSIEQINPNAACINALNWAASHDPAGGTPGAINSIYSNVPDTTAPHIVSFVLSSGTQLALQFSESLDLTAIGGFHFTVSGGAGVSSFSVTGTTFDQVIVNFTLPVDKGVIYTLTATGIADCSGNGTSTSQNIHFVLAFGAQASEIVLNEVLFDPPTGASDFIEIYNKSQKIFDLKNWAFANIDNDTIDNNKTIATNELLFYPGEYLAFTTDKAALIAHYPLSAIDRLIEVPALPAYNNDSGTVVLISNLNHTIDRLSYTAAMHFALLSSVDGVSLERLDFNRPTNEAGNWHSASQEAGFATPGYQNSQYDPNGPNGGELTLSNEIFSPDNDGYQDVINFQYAFSEPGYVGNATLFDPHGHEIKKLVRNELLGTSGTFTWDGINDKTEKAPIGVYVVYFEYFNLSGTVKKIKKSFVLAGKF